jgi:hypothetical protein
MSSQEELGEAVSLEGQSSDASFAPQAASDTNSTVLSNPYKIAGTLEDVRAIMAKNDGSIPVTNVQVPEILDGDADGIIITEQDLNEAANVLNYVYTMNGGNLTHNLVTSAVDVQIPPASGTPIDSLLGKYTGFGVYFDRDVNKWMYGDKPIGILSDGSFLFVGMPVDSLSDNITESDYAYLSVAYKRVDLIDSLVEMTPQQAAKRVKFATEKKFDIISLVTSD